MPAAMSLENNVPWDTVEGLAEIYKAAIDFFTTLVAIFLEDGI
jgi:hypothetical protein